MFWTIDEKANYIAKRVMLVWKEDGDLKEAIKEALKEIAEAEKGSGWSGV